MPYALSLDRFLLSEAAGAVGIASRKGEAISTNKIEFKVAGKYSAMTLWGVNREREIPVPIPNTEVKPLIGDDTWRETAWESSTMPL